MGWYERGRGERGGKDGVVQEREGREEVRMGWYGRSIAKKYIIKMYAFQIPLYGNTYNNIRLFNCST